MWRAATLSRKPTPPRTHKQSGRATGATATLMFCLVRMLLARTGKFWPLTSATGWKVIVRTESSWVSPFSWASLVSLSHPLDWTAQTPCGWRSEPPRPLGPDRTGLARARERRQDRPEKGGMEGRRKIRARSKTRYIDTESVCILAVL